jgi:glucose-6-phosphate 1-dehydrogenase
MLLPSLLRARCRRLLRERPAIVGTARSGMTDSEYRNFARAALEKYLPPSGAADGGFPQPAAYQPLDATTLEGYADLAEEGRHAGENLAIFLSTAPSLFEPTIEGLQSPAGLTGEKCAHRASKSRSAPTSPPAARSTMRWPAPSRSRIFRIDHYLGKETVQNLLALRFANMLFEPLWNAAHIDHVQITVAETVGLEGPRRLLRRCRRAARHGAEPHAAAAGAGRDGAAGAASMPPPCATRRSRCCARCARSKPGETHSVTGQYRAGRSAGQPCRAMTRNWASDSDTETFVAIKAHVDNWRWKGVPFYLRTGKRLPKRVTEIIVQFRCVPHSIFGRARRCSPTGW